MRGRCNRAMGRVVGYSLIFPCLLFLFVYILAAVKCCGCRKRGGGCKLRGEGSMKGRRLRERERNVWNERKKNEE